VTEVALHPADTRRWRHSVVMSSPCVRARRARSRQHQSADENRTATTGTAVSSVCARSPPPRQRQQDDAQPADASPGLACFSRSMPTALRRQRRPEVGGGEAVRRTMPRLTGFCLRRSASRRVERRRAQVRTRDPPRPPRRLSGAGSRCWMTILVGFGAPGSARALSSPRRATPTPLACVPAPAPTQALLVT
jgi:hypothetical protein